MKDKSIEDEILEIVQRAIGVTPEEAKKALDVAKRKVEASMLVGVAGFWS